MHHDVALSHHGITDAETFRPHSAAVLYDLAIEHAARVFRQHGYTQEAEEILIAQRKVGNTADCSSSLVRKTRQAVYGAATGYGYRPGRVLWLLGALLALVMISLQIPAGQATMRALRPRGKRLLRNRTAAGKPCEPDHGARPQSVLAPAGQPPHRRPARQPPPHAPYAQTARCDASTPCSTRSIPSSR